MMYEEDIAKVDNWFDRHTENYGTYRTDREYSLSDWDMQEFADFLRKEFPDLVGIRCYFGTGDCNLCRFAGCSECDDCINGSQWVLMTKEDEE